MKFQNNWWDETNMLCAFCWAKRTWNMLAQFDYSMWSEWTWPYWEILWIEIKCSECWKTLYQKHLN